MMKTSKTFHDRRIIFRKLQLAVSRLNEYEGRRNQSSLVNAQHCAVARNISLREGLDYAHQPGQSLWLTAFDNILTLHADWRCFLLLLLP
jgi:hypothetical protein